jgi:DNA-binding PadR family transcriptional regulator
MAYIEGYMVKTPSLGEFEQIVLLAVLRLKDAAYGVSIRREIAQRTGRDSASGALYTTLDRMERKGLVKSRMGDATPERGGRAKRYYRITVSGSTAIARAQHGYQRMLEGLKLPRGAHV